MDSRNVGVTSAKSGSKLRKFLVILVPILIVVGFVVITQIIIALNKKPEEKRRPYNPLAVLAEYATQEDVQLLVTTQGEARPRTEIDLVPEVAGKITFVSPKFISGGIFNKGDILFRIDQSNYQVAVVRAEAAVARAQQVLVRENAESDIARKDWAELGTGPASDLTLRKPQMLEAQAGLQSAQADLENAKLQLNRTNVRAPFSGRVREKVADIGQYVSPGSRLGRIFSNNIIEVRLPFTDNDLSKIDLPIAYVAKDRESAPDVNLSATIGGVVQNWSGKIMRTDSTYDTQTRALFAIAEVFDPYGEGASQNGVPLAPGLYVDAEVEGYRFEDVVVISRDGLRPENKVYVGNEDGTAEARTATVLDTTMDYAFITEGVSTGEMIILSPVEESRFGGPLKIVDINDPTIVYVDPPKPDWLIAKEKAEDEAKNNPGKKKRKGKKNEGEDKDKKIEENADAAASTTNE